MTAVIVPTLKVVILDWGIRSSFQDCPVTHDGYHPPNRFQRSVFYRKTELFEIDVERGVSHELPPERRAHNPRRYASGRSRPVRCQPHQ